MLKKSFCRMCAGFCGLDVRVEAERVVSVRGEHPMSARCCRSSSPHGDDELRLRSLASTLI